MSFVEIILKILWLSNTQIKSQKIVRPKNMKYRQEYIHLNKYGRVSFKSEDDAWEFYRMFRDNKFLDIKQDGRWVSKI